MIYIDANIFFYASDDKSQYFADCQKFLKTLIDGYTTSTTSVETIQEIMHYYRSIKREHDGLEVCRLLLTIIPEPLAVDLNTIKKFLELFNLYPKPESRDLLHLAACVIYGIKTIVTYDQEFKNFSEVRATTPDELI